MIKIDTNNIKQLTIITIILSFILCLLILFIIKPICILEVNKNTGAKSIYIPLLLLYSTLFSLVAGTIVFLIYGNHKKNISGVYG